MLNVMNHQTNANLNLNDIIPSHLSEGLLVINEQTSVDKNVEEREPSCTIGENTD